MFTWLKKLFQKLLKFLKKFWPILLIAALVFIPGASAFLSSAWTWLGGVVESYGLWTTLALGLGALAIISPEAASDIVKNVGDVLGDIGNVAGEVVGNTVGSFVSNVGIVPLAIGGFLLYLLLTRDKDEPSTQPEQGGGPGPGVNYGAY